MCYENLECWRIFVCFALLFVVPSCCYFWKFLLDFERKNNGSNN